MKNQFVLKPSGLIEGQRSPTILIEGPRNGGEETVFTPYSPRSRRKGIFLFLGIGMMLFALILGVVLVVMGYDDLDLNQEEQVLIPTATGERVTCEREIIPEDWTDPINGEYYYELVVLCNINQRIVDLLLEKKHEQYLDLPLILNYPEGEVAVNGRECIEWLGFTAEGKGPLTPTTFRCMMVVYELKGWNRKKREKEYRHHLYTSDLARLGLMK